MNTIYLEEAIRQIAWTARDSEDTEQPRPYVFIVGAGISFPSVPCASEIERNCKITAAARGHKEVPSSGSPSEAYSYWFEAAYPNPGGRQRYLAKLIENKAISLANFRLAHLLMSERNKVANVVVTPNFDDFLSRALGILGQRKLRICDHPGTVERIDETQDDIRIVHVHGTYWFYDLANLQNEIKRRAKPELSTAFTMAQLLDSIFRQHSPLVVGYSGWDGDVIMTALRRRLTNRLQNRMYWFCHDATGADKLPDWLKDHPDMYFVVPANPAGDSFKAATYSSATSDQLVRGSASPLEPGSAIEAAQRLTGATSQENVLDARTVFERLIAEMQMGAPPLFRDPLAFFASQLEQSIPADEDSLAGAAYSFASVVRRIHKAWEHEQLAPMDKVTEATLEAVRDALRRSAYEEALNTAQRIDFEHLELTERRELVDGLSLAAAAHSSGVGADIEWIDKLVQVYDQLAIESPKPQDAISVANLLNEKATALDTLEKHTEELEVYEEILRRFGDATDPAIREIEGKTLYLKALTLGQLNRNEDSLSVYDDIVGRFGASPELSLRTLAARALIGKGRTLEDLGRSDEELAAYDDLVKRFGDAPESELRERVVEALFNKAFTFGQLDRSEEAIRAYEDLAKRYGDSADPAMQIFVAKALVNKAHRLARANRNEEAIVASDEIVKRIGDASDAVLREGVARALINKAYSFGQLQRAEEEILTYDDVIKRFRDAPEPQLREQAAKAMFNKAVTLSMLKRDAEALGAYDNLIAKFGDESEPGLRVQVAKACFNKSSKLGSLGRLEDAVAACDDVVGRFGGAAELPLREAVAKTLILKGATLRRLERNEEAIAIYDEVHKRFADSSEPLLTDQVTKALLGKSETLAIFGRVGEAMEAYRSLVSRLKGATEPEARETLEAAEAALTELASKKNISSDPNEHV